MSRAGSCRPRRRCLRAPIARRRQRWCPRPNAGHRPRSAICFSARNADDRLGERNRWRLEVTTLLPTTLVGSYPQPGWLIDRQRLSAVAPPRVRFRDVWRIAPEFLDEAQDDATLLAIRDQERAGIDIVTDGEMRRESYSNRFATALEGVDIDNPGQAPTRTPGRTQPVPRIVGRIRRKHAVEARDVRFLRANTERRIKITVPGPFTMAMQAQDDHYKDETALAMDYAAAVNEEIRDLFAARQGGPIRRRGAQPRAARGGGRNRRPSLLRLCRLRQAASLGLFLSARARAIGGAANFDRDRAIEARLRRAGAPAEQAHHAGRDRSRRSQHRAAGAGRRAHSARAAACRGRAAGESAGLRHEIPAARGSLRQAQGDGRGNEDRPPRARRLTRLRQVTR